MAQNGSAAGGQPAATQELGATNKAVSSLTQSGPGLFHESIPTLSRFAAGYPKALEAGDRDRARYAALSVALTGAFPDDRHFAAYSVPGIPRRLGMNTEREGSGLTIWERLPDGGIPMVLFVVDVEPAGHDHPVTAETMAIEVSKLRAMLEAHPGGFVYMTTHGYRIVYRLPEPFVISEPVDAERWKLTYVAWLEYLADRYGIEADPACKDWGRIYRLPWVVRDGVRQEPATEGDPTAIGTWDPVVTVPRAYAPPEPVDVPDPTWDERAKCHLHRATMDGYRKRLRAYVRAKRSSEHQRDHDRAGIVERILAGEALTTEIGIAMRGRHNTVHRAAQILGSVLPDAGPEIAVALIRPSIVAIGNLEPKGLDHYLDKIREDYREGAKFIAEARERQRLADERLLRALEAQRRTPHV